MADSGDYRNIFLAVSGLTPQIITETFYILTVIQKINIQEIVIITTSKGKEKVDQSIKDSRSPFVQLCQDYGFSPFDIK
ncbi:MAG: hypothetical protein D6732_02930, partial [Methanobacteriota archaeon]